MYFNVYIIKRLGAIFYDILLAFSLLLFIASIIIIIAQKEIQNIIFFIVMVILFFNYFAISWVRAGQTIGMKAWGLKVIQFDGQNITYMQAIIRFFLAIPSLFLFFFPLFNKKRLFLHDYISKTYLVKIK